MDDRALRHAYAAWMSGGSAGLGLWLAGYKERTTKRRYFSIEEYAQWVGDCKAMELRETGINSEFCEATI